MFVDCHLDLAYNRRRGRDITQPAELQPFVQNETATVGLPDLRRGGVAMICATIFAMPQTAKEAGYTTPDEAMIAGWEQLQYYLRLLTAGEIDLVTHPDDVPTGPLAEGNRAIPTVLLMEGADPIRSPDELALWFDAGLRVIGLAWQRTRYAGGTGAPGPLTDEARALLPHIDRLGLIHDTSHLAEESFWELLERTQGPAIASHSNCRALVPGDRQLSDHMIRALAGRGGVIGINFFEKFLLPPELYKTRRATLDDVARHIDHICQLTGTHRHVGLGTDMDGGLGREHIPHELHTIADLPKLGDTLRDRGYGDDAVHDILAGNWLAYFRNHLPRHHRA
ncbi:MAG: dipeptidase [Tepidisphaerales bacterium]